MSRLAEGMALARRGLLWARAHGGRAALGRAAHWLVDRRHPSSASYESWLAGRSAPRVASTSATAPRCHLSVSVVVPVHDPSPAQLRELVASVREQDHPRWELVLVDDASQDPAVREELDRVARLPGVRVHRRPRAGGISVATNVGAEEARGEVLVLADHDDVLGAGVLGHIAAAFDRDPRVELVYTDEDQLDPRGRPMAATLKTGPSPWTLLSHNAVGHLMAVRKRLWVRLGGLRSAYDGGQDHDLALRAFEHARRVSHLPVLGYRWRRSEGSVSSSATHKPWAYAAGGRAVLDAFRRRGIALADHRSTPWPGVWRSLPATEGEHAPDVVLWGRPGRVARWEAWLRRGVPLPSGGVLRPRRIHVGVWPEAVPGDLWVLDAENPLVPRSLAALAGWSRLPGVGAACVPTVRGMRRADVGWSLGEDGQAAPILPGLHVGAAGPAWMGASVREVAAGLGLLALRRPPVGALAQLGGRALHAADVLALSALPAVEGRVTLHLPEGVSGRWLRPAWPDRVFTRARSVSGCDVASSPLWACLREGLVWRAGRDRHVPRHDLLVDLGVPGGSCEAPSVWEHPDESRVGPRRRSAPARRVAASAGTGGHGVAAAAARRV